MSDLSLWLTNAEETLRQMIRGVFHFIFYWLPLWMLRTTVETLGPVAIKTARVTIAFIIWMAIMFGPFIAFMWIELPIWATMWLLLAIAGSAWGKAHLAKKHRGRIATGIAFADEACPVSLPQRSARPV
jgi:hypothetical protein